MALMAQAMMPTESAAISNEERLGQICDLCLRLPGAPSFPVSCFILALLEESLSKVCRYLDQDPFMPAERLPDLIRRCMNFPDDDITAPAYDNSVADLQQQLPALPGDANAALRQDPPLIQILNKCFEHYSSLNVAQNDLAKIAARCNDAVPGR